MEIFSPPPKIELERRPRRIPRRAVPSYIKDPDIVLNVLMYKGGGVIARDYSGQGNHGTIHGAKWTDEHSASWELRFDEADGDYVSLPNLGFSGDVSITISAWVDPSGGGQNIFGFGTAGTSNAVCSIRTIDADGDGLPDGYKFYFWGNDIDVSSNYGDDLAAQGGVHVVALYDAPNSHRAVYEDTVLLGDDAPADPSFDDTSYVIGGFNDEYFDGPIGQVMVFDVPISESKIKAIHEDIKPLYAG